MLESTGQAPKYTPVEKPKNPAAVELGRLGGLKGGPARAAKLSPKKRAQIAAKAAAKRWGQEGLTTRNERGAYDNERVSPAGG